ncbi:hypothetical protein [Streptomyces sp. NPDC096311]|uniref:hypothetical protein n=1 Tax=Streptomyces sp. NPDC096311 TaxID=3366083 RepID=UPI00380D6966
MLSAAEVASLLARRPYDLRQTGVSFRLSSGVDPMECARRAGPTIAALFRVYAKVLAQAQERANRRIDAALREWNEPEWPPARPLGGRLGDASGMQADQE